MKKLLTIAVIALVAFASCTINEVNVVEIDESIEFQAVVGRHLTKADPAGPIEGATYATSAPDFGTQAYYTEGTGAFFDASPLYIPLSKVSYQTDKWTTETPYYWPKSGSGTLAFFSFSPWAIVGTNNVEITAANGLKIKEWDVFTVDNQKVDIMVADFIGGQTINTAASSAGNASTYNGVPTVFRHKLAQIVGFTFQTDQDYAHSPIQAGDMQFFINKIDIKNALHKGGYEVANNVSASVLGKWTAQTDKATVNFYTDADNDSENKFGYDDEKLEVDGTKGTTYSNKWLLVLPQGFDYSNDVTIELEYTIFHYTDATNHTDEKAKATIHLYSFPNHSWDMNKKISYTITIGMDQITWAPHVAEWEEYSNSISIK